MISLRLVIKAHDNANRASYLRIPCTTGFTIVELLVCISIIGLLMALVLPAVEDVRRTSRLTSCANNLRQIGLSLQQYASVHGCFPSSSGIPNYTGAFGNSPISTMKQFSAFTRLLPYLEQSTLYHSLNYSVTMQDPYLFRIVDGSPQQLPNHTVMSTSLSMLLCPEDGGSGESGWTGGVNYRFNLGISQLDVLDDHPWNGPLRAYGVTPLNSITDGLGTTVMLSEKLRGRVSSPRPNPRVDMFQGGLGYPHTSEESYEACRLKDGSSAHTSTVGLSWTVGTYTHTTYNHVITPNSTVPDCMLFGANPVPGLFGARSNHAGGVQTGAADGSVHFIRSSIQREVWKALGTRAQGEIISGDAY